MIRVLLFVLAALASATAQAQAWPNKPVTMINPFAPGGGVDAFGRPFSIYLSRTLGQQFLVENLAGAGGTVGATAASKRPGDGYNFFLGAVHHTIAESLYTKLPYSLERDFVPITVLAYVPNVVVVHPKHTNLNSIRDVIAFAKANPGKLNYGSAGNGTTHHLAGELFKTMAGVDLTHIPYKGAGPMMQDLLAGQVDMAFDGMGTSAPQIKAGRLKALAVTTEKRSFVDPNVPTMQEAGLPGYETSTWGGLLAPAGTPKATVAKLNAEVNKILAMPDVRQKLIDNGIEPGSGSPQQFHDFLGTEMVKWAKVAKDAGIQPE